MIYHNLIIWCGSKVRNSVSGLSNSIFALRSNIKTVGNVEDEVIFYQMCHRNQNHCQCTRSCHEINHMDINFHQYFHLLSLLFISRSTSWRGTWRAFPLRSALMISFKIITIIVMIIINNIIMIMFIKMICCLRLENWSQKLISLQPISLQSEMVIVILVEIVIMTRMVCGINKSQQRKP